MAVWDGPVQFLFDNTGDLYYGRGFEMLAILEANFCPDTFSHAFATLLSLITNKQDEECIYEFRARFEGHLNNISQLMVSIPPILQAMLFLWALHPHYKGIIDLFVSKQKDVSIATTNSIVSDAKYMDELAILGTNNRHCPATNDPLDNAYPPEVSQVDPVETNILLMTPVDTFDPTLDSPLNAYLSDSMEDHSVSAGVGYRATPGSTQVGFSCSFSWTQGWGVFVCPWSTSVA